LAEIITQPKEAIAAFVASVQGEHLPWGQYSALGLVREGRLVAGVVYNHWSETNCCMHVGAVPGRAWLVPEFLFAAFDYPFNERKLRRVTGLVPKKNAQARKFDEHLGFKLEGSMRHALPHDDLLVYGMLARECRWIKDEFIARLVKRAQRRAELPLAA
jgi:RimJ/RimL family protein N-acetyltransferase